MMYQGYPFRYKHINSLDYRSSKDPQSFQKANVSKASLPMVFLFFYFSTNLAARDNMGEGGGEIRGVLEKSVKTL